MATVDLDDTNSINANDVVTTVRAVGSASNDYVPTEAAVANSVAGAVSTHTALTTGIHGLGTMSQQAASSVAISGGTIDGTTIGVTTPAAITATTITASGGQVYEGGSASWKSNTANNPQNLIINASDAQAGGSLTMFKSRGTLAAQTDVVANDILLGLYAYGYANGGNRAAASMRVQVDGSPVGSNVPSKLRFDVSDTSGSVVAGYWLASGSLCIGTSVDSGRLTVKGATSDGSTDVLNLKDSTGAQVFAVNSDGKIDGASPVPASFADLAAVRTYLALLFT